MSLKDLDALEEVNSERKIVTPILIMVVMGAISSLSLFIVVSSIIFLDNAFPFFAFLSEFVEFITLDKDIAAITANIYLVLILGIFFPSFILFDRLMKFVKSIECTELFQKDYYKYLKICSVWFTIIIVFFGFLPLLYNLFLLGEEELNKLNYIFLGIMLGSLFPYFYLLIDEAKLTAIQPLANDAEVKGLKMTTTKKNKYNNIYFVLSIVFLIFIFVLIFFMYQQNFEWNSDNISNIISALGILGTFTAASAAAWAAITAKNSLLEQSLANERAAKPYLILQNENYEVDIPSVQHPFLFNWDNGLKIENNNKIENISLLKVTNISNGIARKVEVRTEVKEYKSFVETLNKIKKTKNKSINIIENVAESGSGTLEINSEMKINSKIFFENNTFELIGRIERFTALGIKPEDEIKVRIPKVFIVLNNLIMSGDFVLDDSYLLPYLEVNISCESIQEKKYNFKYMVYLDYRNTNIDMFTNDKNIQFSIKIIEDEETLII